MMVFKTFSGQVSQNLEILEHILCLLRDIYHSDILSINDLESAMPRALWVSE